MCQTTVVNYGIEEPFSSWKSCGIVFSRPMSFYGSKRFLKIRDKMIAFEIKALPIEAQPLTFFFRSVLFRWAALKFSIKFEFQRIIWPTWKDCNVFQVIY